MTQAKPLDNATAVQVLCFVLALLVWLSVLLERQDRTKFEVPVRVTNLPASLRLAWPPPAKVEVTVAGPKILLLLLPFRGVCCEIDLRGASAGTASYVLREADVPLPEKELKLAGTYPAAIPLALVATRR